MIAMISIFVIWPFFAGIFLLCKRKQLEDEVFKSKCNSMYAGVRVKEACALMYTSMFCLRRLSIVVTLYLLEKKDIWLILAYNGV